MNINGVEFPNDLIESIQENRLVVFAGAGVSMGAPTNLPDFAKLTRTIAKNTSERLGRRKDYEVFLGELKDNNGTGNGPDVNKIAAEIILNKCSKPNKLHNALVNLFPKSSDIRIVTTNYDHMFEKVFAEKEIRPQVYDVPALPLGSDILGLVHLHGNVTDPRYIVLTDEDFGKAYLTDGYASRFLVQLFTQYDVLFVGYSLNDVVMSYLTKAITRVSERKKFILTDKVSPKWDSYRIKPIYYPCDEHDSMACAVKELGERIQMDLLQWKGFFEDIKYEPPQDMTKSSMVSYCLNNFEKTRIMVQIIIGGSWVSFLDTKNVFEKLFIPAVKLEQQDLLWLGWLSKEIICNEPKMLFNLLVKHNNKLNEEFALSLNRTLISYEETIKDTDFKELVIILKDYINEEYILHALLDGAYRRKNVSLYWSIFQKLFDVELRCENSYLLSESVNYTHAFASDAHSIRKYWQMNESELVSSYYLRILRFCIGFVETLHDEYVLIGEADHDSEPWKVSKLPLETDVIAHEYDGLYTMVSMFVDSSVEAQKHNPALLRGALKECLNSDSVFLRKLALISIRETKVFNCNQKLKLILDANLLLSEAEKQQTKKLISSLFDDLEDDKKDYLLNEIEYIISKANIDDCRLMYSYLRSVKESCDTNHRVDEIMNRLNAEYDFNSLYNPTPPQVDERLKMNSKEILELNDEGLESLFSFVSANHNAFGIHDLVDEISFASGSSYDWVIKAVKVLINLRVSDDLLWNYLLWGATKNQLSVSDYYNLLLLTINPFILEDNALAVARLFLCMLQHKDIDCFFKNSESNIFTAFLQLWEYRRIEHDNLDITTQSMNSSCGILVTCCIYMIDLHDERYVPKQYMSVICESLSEKSEEYYISLSIIAGHYGFFHYLEPQWCVNTFNPILSGNRSDKEFVCAWNGFVMYSGVLNIDYVDDISKAFLSAVRKMMLLTDDSRYRFIDLFVTLLVYVINNPRTKYIPNFYSCSTDKDKQRFVSRVGYYLERIESEKKSNLWNRWLHKHLVDRLNNIPKKPLELELEEYLNWLPHLNDEYDDAVDILCNGLLPKNIGYLFFEELIKSGLVETNQRSTWKLLINLCEYKSTIPWKDGSIRQIVEMLDELSEDELQLLKQALVKNGWE